MSSYHEMERRNSRRVESAELPERENSAPACLRALVQRAAAAGASDIHLQRSANQAVVALRLDGVMQPWTTLEGPMAERVFGRIKYLAHLKTYQESLPQDGRIDRAALETQGDLRVSTYPTITGEKIVIRLFHRGDQRTLDQLGFPPQCLAEVHKFLSSHAGLMLLTGPAGSGKTTTIYACLQELSRSGERHVITVEDPVEQVIPGIMQTEVQEARGLNFATAIRHLLRQDPQVLVVGEIRDEETANITVRAALTGHLVISTLHAGSCSSVFDRLLNMASDHFAAISSVALVLNQRLIRRLCRQCRGDGCEACLGSGFHGRVPVVEWLRPTREMRRIIRGHGTDSLDVHPAMATMAWQLVKEEITTPAEIHRVIDL